MGHKERAWRELEMAVLLDEPDINAHLEKVYLIHVGHLQKLSQEIEGSTFSTLQIAKPHLDDLTTSDDFCRIVFCSVAIAMHPTLPDIIL